MKFRAAVAVGVLFSHCGGANAQCGGLGCDAGAAGLANIAFTPQGNFEDEIRIDWDVVQTDVEVLRIYANGIVIHCEYSGGTCSQPTGFLDMETGQSFVWDTLGKPAGEFCMRIETVRNSSTVCAAEAPVVQCPPVGIITSPPPNRPGLSIPNDEFFPSQWAAHNVNSQEQTYADVDMDLPQAWVIEAGHPDVIVAVGDNLVEWRHPDLWNRLVPGWTWAPPGSPDPGGFDPFACPTCSYDASAYNPDNLGDGTLCPPLGSEYCPVTVSTSYHGARVASIIAAQRNNSLGVAGIAGGSNPDDGVRIMPIKITGYGNHEGVKDDGATDMERPPCPVGSTAWDTYWADGRILSPSWGVPTGCPQHAGAFDWVASSLEYITYLRAELGVNIRVANFTQWALCPDDCESDPAVSPNCADIACRLDGAIERAWDAGIFIVASMGPDDYNLIAQRPKVCSVGDLTMLNVLSAESGVGSGSNCDPCDYDRATSPCEVTIVAPGSQLITPSAFGDGDTEHITPQITDDDEPWSIDLYRSEGCGTSFSAPQVAGVAALLFSYYERYLIDSVTYPVATAYQNLGPAEVWTILCTTADDLGDKAQYGAGRVNAYNALLKLRGQPDLPGDVNEDDTVDQADVNFLHAYVFASGPPSDPMCLMDVNGDGMDGDAQDYKDLKSFVNNRYPDLIMHEGCFP